ncbi:MAG: sigma-70 family RNA polymerase sigma factor [Flavobacteriales bacterium]|nr:sigma-70 family RNA polymerase sigma factor [Flavobacteriales bacterium]
MTEEQRFLDLMHEHQRIVLRLVGLYANDADERKDLEQEVLLQAWKGFPSFRGEAKFSTWLHRVALNTILTQKRRPRLVERGEALERSAAAVHDPAPAHDDAERLRQALRQLPETDRALIALHLDGFNNGEVAGILGITANHVGVKLHRIKTRLTELLQPH